MRVSQWVLSVSLSIPLWGCRAVDFDTASSDEPPMQLGAAFVGLDHVDVYSLGGGYLNSVDNASDFVDSLPEGAYYMDFVDENGNGSFTADGRMAFAPQGTGFLPVDGPFEIEDASGPVWLVEVAPELEANARLTLRAAIGDESLRPWKDVLPEWQVNLPPEEMDAPDDDITPVPVSYSTTTSSSSARLRVTWELAFAMTGNYSGSCNTSTSCWTRSGTAPGSTSSYYATWDSDGNGTGYIDYDETAWDLLTSKYTSGDASCAQSGYSSSVGCGVSSSIGVGTGKNYTCQSSSGSCTGGTSTSATKPRGGQCKAFQNLVLYRSGQYRSSGGWKKLPSDSTISGYSSSGTDAPTTSTSNIAVGDVLRRLTTVHSMTVVAYDSATQQALVVDSNYQGTTSSTYNEYIGAMVVGFSTTTFTSSYKRLSNYRNLKCVYTGRC